MRDEQSGYVFDDFFVDVRLRQVIGPGNEPLALTTKAFDTLLYLVQRPGEVVDKRVIPSRFSAGAPTSSVSPESATERPNQP